MPETTKTYANIEILQGADYEITVTLDANTNDKSYMVTICKDYTGATDFAGSTDGNGTSANPYRTQITENNVANRGKLVTSDGTQTVQLVLYAQWTQLLPDDFDGYWEMVERNANTTPDSYSRIAQGEVYISKTASRYATTETLTG